MLIVLSESDGRPIYGRIADMAYRDGQRKCRGNENREVKQSLRALRQSCCNDVRVRVPAEQADLEEEHARVPHPRRAAEAREQQLADHRLDGKEQDSADEQREGEEEGVETTRDDAENNAGSPNR